MLAESAKYPATPNKPRPVPPFFAAGVSSAFASSTWSCTSNFTSSVMFLMMSPTARSATSAPLVDGEPTDLSTGRLPENGTLRQAWASCERRRSRARRAEPVWRAAVLYERASRHVLRLRESEEGSGSQAQDPASGASNAHGGSGGAFPLRATTK